MRLFATALLVSCAVGFAGEKRPVVPTEQADDTVALAKDDVAVIKSGARGVSESQASLPSLQVPDLSVPPPSTLATRTKPEAARAKPSSNWLVDGVMAQKRAQEGGSNHPGDTPIPPKMPDDIASGLQDSAASEELVAAKESVVVAPEPEIGKPAGAIGHHPVNPLDAFMASWMSGKDLEALKPVLSTHGPSEGPAAESAPLDLPGADFGQTKVAASPVAAAPAGTAAGDNPFIELLSAPAPSLFPETEVRPTPIAPSQPAINTSVAPETKGAVPDYAKDLQEDPAFKQMRRF